MNYADGTKHEAGEEIRTTSKLPKEKSDTQKVVDDVASDGIFQSVTREESDKDKDKLSKGRQVTERVEKSEEVQKDSGGESGRDESKKHALGFYRVLRNPVEINGDGNTKEEINKVKTADNSQEKSSCKDEQCCSNNEGEENGNISCEKGEEGKRTDQSDAPIAPDEDLTTYSMVSSGDSTDDNEELSESAEYNSPDVKSDGISLMETPKLAIADQNESSDLFLMEKELKVVEVKFREVGREIELLEKDIEAGAGEIEDLEFELNKVEAECAKKLQYKEDLEKHLRGERLKVTSENINIKESISCIEASRKEDIGVDDPNNEEMENGETSKTEEETFFSFTPSEVSEDEKTFSVKLETRDTATETVEDEMLAKVEENHSDLLLNCLVRYQPSCLQPFWAKTLLMSFSLNSDSSSCEHNWRH